MPKTIVPLEPDDIRMVETLIGRRARRVRATPMIYRDDREGWLEARRTVIGATDLPAIAHVPGAYSSPYAIWWQKHLGWDLPGTEAQEWGHRSEDMIAAKFSEDHLRFLVLKPLGWPYTLWRDPDLPWLVCTPDRLIVSEYNGEIFPLEIKSDEGGSGWGDRGTDQVPGRVRVQALVQARIFGAKGTYVARKKSSGARRYADYYVPYDGLNKDWLDSLLTAGSRFMTSLEVGHPPDPDGSKATTQMITARFPAPEKDTVAVVDLLTAQGWREARAALRHARAAAKLLDNTMRDLMGKAEVAITPDGQVVARRTLAKRDGYVVAPGEVDTLREDTGHGEQPPRGDIPGTTELERQGETAQGDPDQQAKPPPTEEGDSGGGSPTDQLPQLQGDVGSKDGAR